MLIYEKISQTNKYSLHSNIYRIFDQGIRVGVINKKTTIILLSLVSCFLSIIGMIFSGRTETLQQIDQQSRHFFRRLRLNIPVVIMKLIYVAIFTAIVCRFSQCKKHFSQDKSILIDQTCFSVSSNAVVGQGLHPQLSARDVSVVLGETTLVNFSLQLVVKMVEDCLLTKINTNTLISFQWQYRPRVHQHYLPEANTCAGIHITN